MTPPQNRYGILNFRELILFLEMLRKTFRNQVCNGEGASSATAEGKSFTLPEAEGFQ